MSSSATAIHSHHDENAVGTDDVTQQVIRHGRTPQSSRSARSRIPALPRWSRGPRRASSGTPKGAPAVLFPRAGRRRRRPAQFRSAQHKSSTRDIKSVPFVIGSSDGGHIGRPSPTSRRACAVAGSASRPACRRPRVRRRPRRSAADVDSGLGGPIQLRPNVTRCRIGCRRGDEAGAACFRCGSRRAAAGCRRQPRLSPNTMPISSDLRSVISPMAPTRLAATSHLTSPTGRVAAAFRPASATIRILWCFSETNRLIRVWPERAVAFQSISRTSSPGT